MAHCKACQNKKTQQWVTENHERDKQRRNELAKTRYKENRRRYAREYYQRIKSKAYDHYGRECACCGESEEMFLSLDHINNDGAQSRKENGLSNANDFLHWIIKNDYPDNIQTLCYNCNLGKHRNGGICPHGKNHS